MKQKPPIPFFSNENFENLIKWHSANLLELDRERDRLRYILEEAPTAICRRYGIEPMESTEEAEFVTMRFIKGQQWSELAEAFHVSESTVKKRWRQKLLDRAKKIMVAEIFSQ